MAVQVLKPYDDHPLPISPNEELFLNAFGPSAAHDKRETNGSMLTHKIQTFAATVFANLSFVAFSGVFTLAFVAGIIWDKQVQEAVEKISRVLSEMSIFEKGLAFVATIAALPYVLAGTVFLTAASIGSTLYQQTQESIIGKGQIYPVSKNEYQFMKHYGAFSHSLDQEMARPMVEKLLTSFCIGAMHFGLFLYSPGFFAMGYVLGLIWEDSLQASNGKLWDVLTHFSHSQMAVFVLGAWYALPYCLAIASGVSGSIVGGYMAISHEQKQIVMGMVNGNQPAWDETG